MRHLFLFFLLASCKHNPSGPAQPNIPPGEVWLTPEQIKEANVEIKAVEEQEIDDTILTSGRVTLDDLRAGHVFSPVTGRVVKINAQLGERVKKGDPLAVIESPDVGTAVSDVHKAQADLIAAEHDLTRKKDLYARQAASLADVEAAEDNYRKAQAELERARQKQFLLRVGNIDMVTQTYTLPAPIDGEVLLRNINPGVEVQGMYSGGANQELFTIGEIDKVWVIADLYEMDLRRVHVGSAVSVSVVAYPDKVFKGQVDWVSGMLDPNTRTARVRCTFDNARRELRPEMYATAEISVDRKKALAMPRTALLRLGEYKIVLAQIGEDGGYVKFKRTPVDVDEGEASPILEVKHGLTQGQRIVVSGAAILSQGM